MRHPPIGELIIALWSPKWSPTWRWCRLRLKIPAGVAKVAKPHDRTPVPTRECKGESLFSPRGPRTTGELLPSSRPLVSASPVLVAERQTVMTAAITANEWLAGRHDAHLPSHQRLASPLLGSWRSRRWLCSAAPPPALLAPRRHAGARAFVFPLVPTYAPSASCGLPPINGAASSCSPATAPCRTAGGISASPSRGSLRTLPVCSAPFAADVPSRRHLTRERGRRGGAAAQ